MKRLILCAAVLAVGPASAATITHDGVTITMDFVSVGNTDNVADDTGYGGVGYSYNIGKYEVTADQWAAVLAAAPGVGNAGNWSGSQPTCGTSWYEAARFCNWLTTGDINSGVYNTSTWSIMDHQTAGATFGTAYFIPTEDEWYKAAYYDGGNNVYYNYPTGSDSVPDGIDSNGDTTFDAVFDDGYNQGHPNDTDNAGDLSPYGTMGQGGNVWNWNETVRPGSSRGVRGGYWGSNSNYLHASNRSSYSSPMVEKLDYGFRVASVPEAFALTSIRSGDWHAASTWDTPHIPNDDIDIAIRDQVTITADGSASSLLMDSTDSELVIGPGSTLTVDTSVDIGPGSLSIVIDGPNNGMLVAGNNVNLDTETILTIEATGKLQGWWYGDQTRTIITANGSEGIVGEFANVPDAVPPISTRDNHGQGHLGRGVFLIDQGVVYEDHAVKLELLQAAPGDANGDRRVDFADIKALLASGLWNITEDPGDQYIWPPTWTEGDFTGDGLVSFDDITALLSINLWNKGIYGNLGSGKSVNVDASAAVPEPSTFAMLIMGAVGLIMYHRRKRN